MTPSSGAISLSQIRSELGLSGALSLGSATVRQFAFVPSGAISFRDNYAVFRDVISSNTQNINMRSRAVSNGWNQSAPLKHTLIVNSGIVIGSSSTGSFALDTGSSFPSGSGLRINNNGHIVGAGGNGGLGRNVVSGGMQTAGGAGGTAIRLQYATQIQNNNVIGGGGGGGAGGGGFNGFTLGGGGGGGAGNSVGLGNTGFQDQNTCGAQSIQSSNGTLTNGGNTFGSGTLYPAGVGAGGSAGVSGGDANQFSFFEACYGNTNGAGGGGLGASGGGGFNVTGGAGGSATSGSGSFATWLATGTRYGAIN